MTTKKSKLKPIIRKQPNAVEDNREERTLKVGGDGGKGVVGQKWWLSDRPHQIVPDIISKIAAHQRLRRYNLIINYNNYAAFQTIGIGDTVFSSNQRGMKRRFTLNVVKSCVDTATALIAQNRVRVMLLPQKGDYKLERQSKLLQQFLDGGWNYAGVYQKMPITFRAGAIGGTGCFQFVETDGDIKMVFVPADEVFVDDMDGQYGDPRELFRKKTVSVDELCYLYPQYKDKINSLRSTYSSSLVKSGSQDYVTVRYAWHLPTGRNATDGRYCVCIENCTLENVEYKYDYHQIQPIYWTPPDGSFWGVGIPDEIAPIQSQLNEIVKNIGRSLREFAVPRVFVEQNSKVGTQLTNDISVNTYSGSAPTFLTPAAFASETFQYVQWLNDLAYKQCGISQLSASSQKPAGLDSAIALRTYKDNETQRFALIGQAYEDKHVMAARMYIDKARECYKSKKMKVYGRKFIETIDWNDIDLEDEQYGLQAFPTNILPIQPEGRLATAQEYINSGMMDKVTALEQLRMPIMNDYVDRQTSGLEWIKNAISKILVDGEYVQPNNIVDLQMALQMVNDSLLQADVDDAPQDRILLLTQFQQGIQDEIAKSQAPAQQAPAPGGAPQAAAGQAPPPPPAAFAPQGSGQVPPQQ